MTMTYLTALVGASSSGMIGAVDSRTLFGSAQVVHFEPERRDCPRCAPFFSGGSMENSPSLT